MAARGAAPMVVLALAPGVHATMSGRGCCATNITGGGKCEDCCEGVSPTGTRWAYAMYPHTGTVSVSNFLDQKQQRALLNTSGCKHQHAPCCRAATDAVISFVANPFRIVLSMAAYIGVVDGSRTAAWAAAGRHRDLTNRTVAQQVRI